MADSRVLEVLVFPPLDEADVVEVESHGRGGYNAAVPPNEVLKQAAVNVAGHSDVGHPCSGRLACVHGVDGRDMWHPSSPRTGRPFDDLDCHRRRRYL